MNIKKLDFEDKEKNSINSLSPYIGKMRIDLAKYLIKHYSEENSIIYDPFAGSGTVLLEGWALGHEVIGNDLNYYAYVLTMGKLNPYETFEKAEEKMLRYKSLAERRAKIEDITSIPEWIKSFYNEETLKEICSWVYYLKRYKEWFLLSCLMGILHHQRPGFLSYPASHGAPYLRSNKYPIEFYPEMYQYKNVYEKLYNKVKRSYKNVPNFNYTLSRRMFNKDATTIRFKNKHFSTIITSPPYMKSLTYARDNRLRLWFLGEDDWITLDKKISPEKNMFIEMMQKCFEKWAKLQETGDKCIIVIGDINIIYNSKKTSLFEILINLSKNYYTCVETLCDPLPEAKKVVKGNARIKQEIIVVFERK
ncbi:MAG: hypothetical protein HDT47_04855 [Ruminococcaceae bacterium]|nr:hypothetical protein [Oscillospiraceae bacterium]